MIDCLNCGSFMRFDIESQQLKCDHCGTYLEVGEAKKIRTAEESEPQITHKIQVYEFICPQCNGTVYGGTTDLTGFCAYCGSPVELNGRLTKINHPKYIIPFRKTKEDCKKAFRRVTGLSPFLPSGFKDEAHVESFRGIYMPYYLYSVQYDKNFNLKGRGVPVRRGDYVYTKCYDIRGKIDGGFTGFEHDSSKEFADDISEGLSPFMNQERLSFDEGYVSGFYAEASDVPSRKYENTAKTLSSDVTFEEVKHEAKKKKFGLRVKQQKMNKYITSLDSERALYPVWFMAYRHKERVSYAAVNGQTGKIVADLPISISKFLISVILFTIPFYFMLEKLVTFTPITLISFFTAFMAVTMYFYQRSLKNIVYHEGYDYDALVDDEKVVGNKLLNIPIISLLSLIIVILSYLSVLIRLSSISSHKIMTAIVAGISILVHLFFAVSEEKANIILKKYDIHVRGRRIADLTSLFMAVACVVSIFTFVADYWYYGVCILLLIGIVMLLMCIVLNHNMLATRKPVQFNKKGGDDHA